MKGVCIQPLTYLGRKEGSVFENTCEPNHREEASELAPACGQPIKEASLVAKIAQGVTRGKGGGRTEKGKLVS